MSKEVDIARVARLAAFATARGIGADVAWVLPAVFERISAKLDIAEEDLIAQAMINRELGRYIEQGAREVAAASQQPQKV